MPKSEPHISVMRDEFLEQFADCHIKVFFDGTLGAGGHARALLEAHPEIETYIGCDQDPTALEIAKKNLEPWQDKTVFYRGNFSELSECVAELGIKAVDGFFFDVGVSSMQFDQEERGFSFKKSGPLDMRMDPSNPISAKEVVNEYSEQELGECIRDYGEEPFWRRITKAIVEARKKKPIETTKELADIVLSAIPNKGKKSIHPATLVFQALRICVNRELESLEEAIKQALSLLKVGGKMGVISFHSLEDRIVKNVFRAAAEPPRSDRGRKIGSSPFKVVTKKPITPRLRETRTNRRARSAKMRFLQRI
ncbi:MAG: 16S rRNA (cytosine(1402)-N(4))-methyltransferase RsmH [Simkaniaceae bacterium]|nr:16S rRNA (cytosine(1402)-N(4))-methyltransferase RsmH [Simkaniaceae bacterium]